MLLMIFLLHNFEWCLACWGWGGEEETTTTTKKPNMFDPEDKRIWGGWNPPPGAGNAWKNWLQYYNAEHSHKGGYKDPNSPGKPYGHDIPGFPHDWRGLGDPYEGVAAPPWAYVPKNLGKPGYCSLPPDSGHCREHLYRWGYSAFNDECQLFFYRGCGGNRNNFIKLETCEKACKHRAETGCNTDSGIPVDDIINA